MIAIVAAAALASAPLQRRVAGHVTGFVDRREGEDIVWARVASPP